MASLPPVNLLAKEIYERRKAIGYSRRRLAAVIGITESALFKIEKLSEFPEKELIEDKGKRPYIPTYMKFRKIIKTLDGLQRKSTAGGVMHSGQPQGVDVKDTVEDALKVMNRSGPGYYSQLVVYDGGKIIGSITERKLMDVKLDERKTTKIGKIKEPMFPIVNEDTSIDICRELLRDYYALLVQNEEGLVVGIISRWDIANK